MGVAVPLRLVGMASCGWRCALGIAGECGRRCAFAIGGESVVWVALCHCDWRGERGAGGAVLLGLRGRALCGWRCAVVIGGERVVWVALCCWDWWGG